MSAESQDEPVPLSGTPLSPSTSAKIAFDGGTVPTSITTSEADALTYYENQLKQQWDDAVHRNMKPRDCYDKVVVLMIRWTKELDQIQCEDEVKELAEVFANDYNFEIRHLLLHNNSKPQHQLSSAIANFVNDFDEPDGRNLLIVYYAGHGGWQSEGSQFWLEASTSRQQAQRRKGHPCEPNACWNTAEQPLDDAESDVFAIFDACNAANLLDRNSPLDNKNYEILCASINITEKPGPFSFTRALIKILKLLPTETDRGRKRTSFTTQFLHKRISMERYTNRPFWWNRGKKDDSAIRLGPLLPSHSPVLSKRPSRRQANDDGTDLTLTFQLTKKRKLNDEDVERLTKALPEAFHKAEILCDRISMISHRPHKDRMREVAGLVMKGSNIIRHWSGLKTRLPAPPPEQPVHPVGGASPDNNTLGTTDSGVHTGAGAQFDHRRQSDTALLQPDFRNPTKSRVSSPATHRG